MEVVLLSVSFSLLTNLGFLIGPQTFRDAPYYYNAKYVIIAMWFIALCFFVVLYFLNKWENAKRDRIWEEAGW